MQRIKTFTTELKIFKTMEELNELDNKVNQFILENRIGRVLSISDTAVSQQGDTIGLIRTILYEE